MHLAEAVERPTQRAVAAKRVGTSLNLFSVLQPYFVQSSFINIITLPHYPYLILILIQVPQKVLRMRCIGKALYRKLSMQGLSEHVPKGR